jgi:ribosomal-protein-alanine N-acetyltransferase
VKDTLVISLAAVDDALDIAALSRDEIEGGLPWSWDESRVVQSIQDRDTNVAIARDARALAGFGIMKYRDETAHLLLFAVAPALRRRGIGSAILGWLEGVAREGGAKTVSVECRRTNDSARNFYGEHGYHEHAIARGYYRGIEDAVQLRKWLVPPP